MSAASSSSVGEAEEELGTAYNRTDALVELAEQYWDEPDDVYADIDLDHVNPESGPCGHDGAVGVYVEEEVQYSTRFQSMECSSLSSGSSDHDSIF
eukprot:Nk52_evm1s1625 gene=Nk52_evmTU1s1625